MNECREWQGARARNGYGRRYVKGSGRANWKQHYVHRWVWEQVYGPIPKGMLVLHTCDNPPCYRLAHLFLGTPAQNSADMKAKGRQKGGPNAPIHPWPTGHRKPGGR